MPCKKCSNGKWKFGNSKCMYTSLSACKRAAAAYYSSHPGEKENGLQKETKKETGEEINAKHKSRNNN